MISFRRSVGARLTGVIMGAALCAPLQSFLFSGLSRPALAADEAFVTNQNDDTLAVVDLDTMKVEAKLSIPGKPVGVAVARDGRRVYVTSPEAKTLAVIDAEKRSIIKTITLKGGPFGVAVHPSGAPVYVTDWESRLFVVDPEAGAIIAEIQVGTAPSGVAVSGDGRTVVTADRDSDQISIIDAAALNVAAAVKVGRRPFGVTIDDATGRVFAANVASNSVSIVDLAGRKTVAEIATGERPYAVGLAQGKGFVTDQYGGTLTVFDAASFAVLGKIRVAEYPEGIHAGSDGRFMYVANWFDNKFMKIDAATQKIEASVETGDGPRAFGTFIRRK